MAITLKRQIDDDDKAIILKQHGRKCFATGHVIPEGESVHFDHIRAYALGGGTELDNIAPMCGQHNKEKGTLPLEDIRVKLRLQEFFGQGDRLTLRHLLAYLHHKNEIVRFAQAIAVEQDGESVKLSSTSKSVTHTLYTCPTTGWKYFYAILDVDVIDSDDDQDSAMSLQPRYLIFDKVFELNRHFQNHPVLQPSVARVVHNHVCLFDGQHKVAALLWNNRRVFECKVYLSPDVRLLNQTNIAAHDKFAQTRFFSSIMVMKLGSQFGADFDIYRKTEDDAPKTEAGFIDYLQRKEGSTQTKAQINERFRSYLYNSVIEHEDNKAAKYVSAGNRRTDEKPLTIDMLTKSLFSALLYRQPTDDNMVTDAYRRDDEVVNMVFILNAMHDLALGEWNPKSMASDEKQRKLVRIFGSKSMMAWSELFRDALCGKLDIQDGEDRARPLYRELGDDELNRIKDIIKRLVGWKVWISPANDEVDRVLSDNKSAVKEWFRKSGLTTGYLMGAPQ